MGRLIFDHMWDKDSARLDFCCHNMHSVNNQRPKPQHAQLKFYVPSLKSLSTARTPRFLRGRKGDHTISISQF